MQYCAHRLRIRALFSRTDEAATAAAAGATAASAMGLITLTTETRRSSISINRQRLATRAGRGHQVGIPFLSCHRLSVTAHTPAVRLYRKSVPLDGAPPCPVCLVGALWAHGLWDCRITSPRACEAVSGVGRC